MERLSNDVKLLQILENYARKPIYNNIYINLVSFPLYSRSGVLYNSLQYITKETQEERGVT